MAFAIVAALFFLALLTASFASGKYRWRWYAVPAVLALLYVVFIGYVIGATSNCADCRSYQSGPEEARALGFVYGTVVLAPAIAIWGVCYGLGRVAGRRASALAPSR